MRWVPTGILTALALVTVFTCFFHYGQEWMFIPAAILFVSAILVNPAIKPEEPVDDSDFHRRSQS